MLNQYKIEIKWALIYSAMFLVWMVLEKLSGLHDQYLELHQYLTMLILIPAIVVYVWAFQDKKKSYFNGSMTYRQGLIFGLVFTLFVNILSPIVQLITSYIITPDYFNNVIAYTVKTGMLSQEQAEQQFNIKNYLISSTVGGFVTGLVFSAIIAFFVKSKSKI